MAELDQINRNTPPILGEKQCIDDLSSLFTLECNPVIESVRTVLAHTNIVSVNKAGVENAARYIANKLKEESYTPTTWRTHPLHLLPPKRFSRDNPRTQQCLDWIFVISTLNFSFWSELEDSEHPERRYGVEWREGWDLEGRKVHTGYWSLVAAIDKALEAGIPITDPAFYSSREKCPDSLIASVFAAAENCAENIPLLRERITIMRENGAILCEEYGGSFFNFFNAFHELYDGTGTALQLLQLITDSFPSFRDEATLNGSPVFFWKRAQILIAETWAAFYPLDEKDDHPFFPEGVHELTMFADYRVPQILHHLGILTYAPSLVKTLRGLHPLESGCVEEMAIRAGSILAVEEVRGAILSLPANMGDRQKGVSSVLIDFYLWDLAKRIERGADAIEGLSTQEILPAHRTRSIWY